MSSVSDTLDPDIRFLLANERTLLAWVRTALALMAGGLALSTIGHSATRTGVGMATIVLGAGMAVLGYHRFRAADLAIRNGQLPPAGIGPKLQVAGVVGFAGLLLAISAINLY